VLGRGHLKLADFQKVVDANPGIGRIELSNYGEPFLNPDLLGILEYAYRRGVRLTAANGANLNTVRPAVLEGLVKYRFRKLNCSIDGATPETYAKYRVGGDFDVVMENVRTINAYKKQYRTPYPLLSWQFIVFPHNRHEQDAARRLAKQLGMRFSTKLSWDEHDEGPESRSSYRARYGVDYTRAICYELWVMPQINWDGRVLGCCRNYWGEFGGNAFAEGVFAVANSERIGYARDMLLGKRPPREDVPCSTCKQYLNKPGRAMADALRDQAPPTCLALALSPWLGEAGDPVRARRPDEGGGEVRRGPNQGAPQMEEPA
jgi:hypothetical protein